VKTNLLHPIGIDTQYRTAENLGEQMTYQIAGFRTIILLQNVSKGIKTAWIKPIGDKKRTK
jgi:hypothetical protein